MMIGLYSSKSLCDELNKVNQHQEQYQPRLHKCHSTSLILDSPTVSNTSNPNTVLNQSNEFRAPNSSLASSTVNSSPASSSLSLSQEDDSSFEFIINLFANTNTNSCIKLEEKKLEIKLENNFILKKSHKNLDDLLEQYSTKSKHKNKKSKPKKFKQTHTKELAMFKIKRDYNEPSQSFMYSLNENLDKNETYNDELTTFYDSLDTLTKEYNLSHVNLYLNQMDSLETRLSGVHSAQTSLGSFRRNKQNKLLNLKSLLKHKSIQSNSYFKINKISFTKSNSSLYVKFNLNFSLDFYIRTNERLSYKYSNKQIDKRIQLDANLIKTNKLYHKQIEFENAKSFSRMHTPQANMVDPPVVVNYSIDHNRVNTELNQTYDQLYLEFLISLQHREITPEDYEYLSRLDELVKKKTVNDSILNKLKNETITSELLVKLDQERCGICLDGYVLDQMVKYLPCGHLFHSDCIDSWLRNQSTDCPLDKLPVDGSFNDNELVIREDYFTSHVPDEEDDDDDYEDEEIANVLNELCNKVELNREVSDRLEELVEEVCLIDQVENCINDLINIATK